MKIASLSALAVVAAMPAAAPAAAQDVSNPLVEALARCTAVRADAERLACMDAAAAKLVAAARAADVVVVTKEEVGRSRRQLFGLPVAVDVLPGRPVRIEQLVTTIAAAVPLGNGRWTLVLAEGGRWQTTETWDYGDPRASMAVTVKRAALGSYRLSATGQRSVRVQRLN